MPSLSRLGARHRCAWSCCRLWAASCTPFHLAGPPGRIWTLKIWTPIVSPLRWATRVRGRLPRVPSCLVGAIVFTGPSSAPQTAMAAAGWAIVGPSVVWAGGVSRLQSDATRAELFAFPIDRPLGGPGSCYRRQGSAGYVVSAVGCTSRDPALVELRWVPAHQSSCPAEGSISQIDLAPDAVADGAARVAAASHPLAAQAQQLRAGHRQQLQGFVALRTAWLGVVFCQSVALEVRQLRRRAQRVAAFSPSHSGSVLHRFVLASLVVCRRARGFRQEPPLLPLAVGVQLLPWGPFQLTLR